MTSLHQFTPARVGLRRAGNALATRELLDFQLAHAMARDAVHAGFNAAALLADVRSHGWQGFIVNSAVRDRQEFLKRPDLGRRLCEASRSLLQDASGHAAQGHPLAVIVADGLSALAIDRHAMPVLERLRLGRDVPLVIAQQARVALGDEIGELLRASVSLVLIGERPGLSAPDSMGAYITWQPRPGRTDAERFCVSNIRAEGLSYDQAAAQILFLIGEASARQMSGTGFGGGPALPKGNM